MIELSIVVRTSDIFPCSLERAFKTPILCDVTKVHTGFGIMPKIVGTSDDAQWGQVGSTKKVYAAKSLTQKGGFVSIDKVLERVENQRWAIELSDFQTWMLGFYKFVGVWETRELKPGAVQVNYTYSLHTRSLFYYPFAWLFGKLFWKVYMKHAMENIKQLALHEEPYQYP